MRGINIRACLRLVKVGGLTLIQVGPGFEFLANQRFLCPKYSIL